MKWPALLMLSCVAVSAAEKTPTEIVQEYLRAKTSTMRGGASPQDIDRVLAFYTDDIVYEDPKVKVHIEGKDIIRSGMLSHTADYVGSPSETRISIDSSVTLANAVAAVITEVFWVKEDAGRREIRRQRLNVIEFRGDKICRFIDYH